MSRQPKGPRLYFRDPIWVIRDGQIRVSTGCRQGDIAGAEVKLAEYIASKYQPERRQRLIHEIPLADVLTIYAKERMPELATEEKTRSRLEKLMEWWGDKSLADVTGQTCKNYADWKGNRGGARRDLQDLSAAIGYHLKQGYHREIVLVDLPPTGKARDRWLTRNEIAKLVWSAWNSREIQDSRATGRRTGRHIARAILFAYYTGSRIGTALTASFVVGSGRSYLDLDRGLFFRLPDGKKETKKRQPPCRIGDRLMTHLRRWKATGACAAYVVEWEGKPVKSIKTGFARAVKAAGLGEGVVPHTLRHSRATHLKQAGLSSFEVAQALGMSEQMVEQVYGHHDPKFMSRAANAR